MALTVQCEQCGRIILAPDHEAGLSVICLACGSRVQVPAPPPAAPSPAPAATKPAPPPLRSSHGHWFIVLVALLCMTALGIVASVIIKPGLLSSLKRPPTTQPAQPAPPQTPPVVGPVKPAPEAWEAANRAKLLLLANDAHRLAALGKLAEADAKYQQLEQLLEDHELTDPALRSRMEKARAEQEKVFARLVEMRGNGGTQVAVPPPTGNPPTQPVDNTVAVRPPATTQATAIAPPATTQSVAENRYPTSDPITPPVVSVRPPPTVPRIPAELTDDQDGQSIQHAIDFLIEMFEDGRLKHTPGAGIGFANNYYSGMDCLCVYALMQAGQAVNDKRLDKNSEFMKGLIEGMKSLPMNVGVVETYARSVRATALAYFNRPEDRDALKADVGWLLASGRRGAYGYGPPSATTSDGPAYWDNSNSQFALLALWSAAEVGIEIPTMFWQDVEQHWTRYQLENGQWTYRERTYQPVTGGREGSLSMTAAGIASLLVTHDYLDAPKFGDEVGRDPYSPPLARALAWLEQADNAIRLPDSEQGYVKSYTLYGIERVGLASGYKYFGKHDWYRELARQVIAQQKDDGSWNDNRVETAFMLLFLARGRHPVILNKLRYEGYWSNRPRDAANLARYVGRQLERPVNWQIVSLQSNWSDWMDCPILYIASHAPPQLGEDDYAKLRSFVENGGMIFTQADGNSEDFNRFAQFLAIKLFPQYDLKDLPADHELYSLVYPVDPKPPLKALSNGSRILLLHSPTDLSMYWQLRAEKTHRNSFDLGTNIFLYASGKSDLRNRLASPYLPAPAEAPAEKLKLLRLKYTGNWNPEPAAFVRFGRYLQKQTGVGLDVQAVELKELKPGAAPVAHLTGTAAYLPSEAETKALRDYVEAGGVLIIDVCGGGAAFTDSVQADFLGRSFPNEQLAVIGPDHPLLAQTAKAAGVDSLIRPQLRSYVLHRFENGDAPRLRGLRAGRGYVIFSPLDISSGLLGTHPWGILGYRPEFAQSLMRALVMGVKAAPATAPTQP